MNDGVVIFQDVTTHNNVSMALYAQRLLAGIKAKNSALTASIFKPRSLHYPRIVRNMIERVPLVRFYGEEDFVSRHVLYPLMARYNQGRINHIVGDTANIVHAMDARRTVVTCHDIQLISDPLSIYDENHKGFRWYRRRKIGMEKAARVIAISEQTKRDILKYFDVNEDKIRVVYNAVDPRFRRIDDINAIDAVKKAFCLDGICGKILLSVGISRKHKNIEGVIRTLKCLKDSCGDIALVRVGEALTREQMLLVKELGLDDIVHELGMVATEELVLLYNAADLLLFPSFYEGFGWPIVEAFACGTPVVTSKTFSMPEVAGDAASLVDPDKPEEIYKATREILENDTLRHKLIEKGFGRARMFSMERQARDTLKVYDEVLMENYETIEDMI